ncbi:uncharacterized membrane protein YbaN (DUF454 family) [Pseudomonas sp. TE12234]
MTDRHSNGMLPVRLLSRASPPHRDRVNLKVFDPPHEHPSENMSSSSKLTRLLFGLLAYVSLGIGLIAIVIPGLPTTEFILLAAWAATRSSPRLSAWLENHRLFGPILSNWRTGKIIARRAKVSATVSMLLCATLMLVMLDHGWPIYLAIAGMGLGNLWIWSRPESLAQPS